MSIPFLNNYEPNVEALILLVRELKVKVTNTTVNETLQNHPEFPSFLSISDALDRWNIENTAVTVDKDNIDELETPFLALIRDSKNEVLVLVRKIDEDTVSYRKTISQRKDVVISRTEFFQQWSGVALLAQPDQLSGEKKYSAVRRKELMQHTNILALIGMVFLIEALEVVKLIDSNKIISNGFIIGYSALLITKITGFFIVALLAWYEADNNNAALKKLCSSVAMGDCDAVLGSKQAKFLGLIGWTDVGLFYFVGGLISLLAANGSIAGMIPIIGWLSVIALPYTFFSIYYQWRIVKQWCVLCLAVQGLLVIEFVIAFGFKLLLPVNFIGYLDIILIFIAFLAPAITWGLIKPVLVRFHQVKRNGRSLTRLKSDKEIFTTVMEMQKHVSHSPEGLGITLGNPSAENTLITVSNPYCDPCAAIHPEIEKLLEKISNLKVQIIYNANENKDIKVVVKHLLAIHEKGDNVMTKKALDDWYLSPEKHYERFATKYPVNGRLENQLSQVEAMNEWCKNMDIQLTPTFFFNGYQLPEIYHINDLEYILSNE